MKTFHSSDKLIETLSVIYFSLIVGTGIALIIHFFTHPHYL